MPGNRTEEVMDKVSAILPAATTVLLIAISGCATRGDVEALRSDIAALRASTASAGAAHTATTTPAEYQKLRSDIAALQASIGPAGATRSTNTTPLAAYERLRSDIAALRASIESAGAIRGTGAMATEAVATTGPPPAEYRKVSTLVKLPEFIPGLGALYVRPQTLPAGPFLAYDRDNRLVSTIYMILVSDVTARKTFEHLMVGDDTVREVDLYYTPGHPGVEAPHYHVVLWHVQAETAKLQ
jgi:hypothetical protein